MTVLFCAPAIAGHAIRDGSEGELFGKDRYSVIVARVAHVWVAKSTDPVDPRDRDMIELAPLATLAGTFDPSVNPTATFGYFSNDISSSIKAPPKEGAIILTVVRDQILIHEDPTPRNVIVSDTCTFMPGGSALLTIKSLDDPAVSQTLERLQKARAIAKRKEALENAARDKKP